MYVCSFQASRELPGLEQMPDPENVPRLPTSNLIPDAFISHQELGLTVLILPPALSMSQGDGGMIGKLVFPIVPRPLFVDPCGSSWT